MPHPLKHIGYRLWGPYSPVSHMLLEEGDRLLQLRI